MRMTWIVPALTITTAAAGQCLPDGWASETSLPGARSEMCSAEVNGQIYLFGDYNHSDDHDWVARFDPADGSITPLSRMPSGRGEAAAAACGDDVYVFGGNDMFENNWLKDVWRYHIPTDTWHLVGEMPVDEGRGYLSAVTVGDEIHVFGGVNSYEPDSFADHIVLDCSNGTFTVMPDMPRARATHGAVAFHGLIYLVGGHDRTNGPEARVELDIYDPETGTWSEGQPLPTARGHLSVVVQDGTIVAMAGQLIDGNGDWTGVRAETVERYDPVLDCWRAQTPLPDGRMDATAQTVRGLIYLFGGSSNDADVTDTVFRGYPGRIPGDLNGDGFVTFEDLLLLISSWGS